MKLAVLSASIGVAFFGGLAAPVAAQQTGLEALAILARDKGAAAGAQVVVLSGIRGAEQPAAWRLVMRDPAFAGQFREITVKGGRVVGEHAVPPAESVAYATTPLVRGKIRIDSPVVFWRAHTEAKKALVGFDTVDYELRNAEFSTRPVWMVVLKTRSGVKVGELAVSAESGNVMRRTWFEAGRQTARPSTNAAGQRPGSPPPSAVLSETAQKAWKGTRTGLNEGTKAVKTGLSKASTTVGSWLIRAGGGTPPPTTSPQRTASPAPTPPPTQTSGPATWEQGRYDSKTGR